MRCAAPASGDVVYLVDRGWHVELGLPADQVSGKLAVFRAIFPGARALMFGYGKRTFFTAKTDSLSEYLLGPLPGPAAIQVTGLSVLPDAAYDRSDTLRIPLPQGGAARLSDFLWNDLQPDQGGQPRLIGSGPFPGSLFYAARSHYGLGHTCNTWVAEALNHAGTPVSASGVMLSGQIVARAEAAGACQPDSAAP